MKVVVAVRCLNEEKNIERFLRGYSFADLIVVSDGGSTDKSLEMLDGKVDLVHFAGGETVNGQFWNTDNPHINFVLERAKFHNPDWLIFDDMDCVPNAELRENARKVIEECESFQVNAFRLYMWGESQHFPYMNRNFDPEYTSLWAWKPKEINISADNGERHGTIIGTSSTPCRVLPPMVLLHKSWNPDTIDAKVQRYNDLGLPMNHPTSFAGTPVDLPDYAKE